MPAPHGHEKRDKPFALRMSAAEDAYVRDRAKVWGVSLNLAICRIIDHHQEQTQRTAQPPRKPPAPGAAAPRRNPRATPPGKPPLRPAFSDDEYVPGQTSITDPDQ